VDRTTAIGGRLHGPARVQACDNCGEPGVLDTDRHCPRCAKLAQEADAYGTAVALDLLRTAVMSARAYATRDEIAQAIDDALDEYEI
jgi:hypothetical protein